MQNNNLLVYIILSRKNGPVYHSIKSMRPLKNVNFCLSSRKAIILTIGIHLVFRGLKFEPDAEIGRKGVFFKGLSSGSL